MKLYKYINYKSLRSHKIFIGILILIIGAFLFYNPIIEGLTSKIGEYEYLAPPTDNIDDDMWSKLTEKMKKIFDKSDIKVDDIKSQYKKNISNKEINYYLENDRFPVNQYVIDKYKEFSKIMDGGKQTSDAEIETNIKQMSAIYTNRMFYDMFREILKDKDKTPQPEGYLIFMGTKPPPSYSTPTISVNKSTTSVTDSIRGLDEIENKRNYNDLVSLCKRVN